jgi:hypothetical protein
VGGRNRTSLTKGVEKQTAAVRAALEPDPDLRETSVFGCLCFLDSDWGLLDFPFSVGRIWIAYPGAIKKSLRKKGPLAPETMKHIARRLNLSLPCA